MAPSVRLGEAASGLLGPIALAGITAVAVLAAGCNEFPVEPVPQVEISPDPGWTGALSLAEAREVTVSLRDAGGMVLRSVGSVWTSSDPAVVSVARPEGGPGADARAILAGLSVGQATIRVEIDHPGLQGSTEIPVTVTGGAWPDSIAVGESAPLTVDAPEGSTVTWESEDPAVLGVAGSSGIVGEIAGRSQGTTRVVARVMTPGYGETAFRSPMRITPLRVVFESAWPDTLNATRSADVAIRLEGVLGPVTGVPVRWESSDAGILEVEALPADTLASNSNRAAGRFTGRTAGRGTAILTVGGGGLESNEIRHPVVVGQRWIEVSAGFGHTCALNLDGRAFCWGRNDSGELGFATTEIYNLEPRPVATALRFEAIGAGGVPSEVARWRGHTCGNVGRRVLCWGSTQSDQLGRQQGACYDEYSNGICIEPLPVTFREDLGASISGMDVGGVLTCVTYYSPEPASLCEGLADISQMPGIESPGVWYVPVAAGGYHACYSDIQVSYGIFCSGLNHRGQLGDGTTVSRAELGNVIAFVDTVALSIAIPTLAGPLDAGGEHTCAVLSAPEVMGPQLYCWGSNSHGQLGGASADTCEGLPCSLEPTAVALNAEIRSLALGGRHTCVLSPAGEVLCWGANRWGQLGDGTDVDRPGPPASSPTGLRFHKLSAGWEHTCGIDEAGSLYCWGNNFWGQLGVGSNVDYTSPVRVHEPVGT